MTFEVARNLFESEMGSAVLDLTHEYLVFQEVNEREINESNVCNLTKIFKPPGGKIPWQSPMAVVVHPSWIKPSCLSPSSLWYGYLKHFELTEEGKGKLLKMLSGHHRKVVCERIAATLKTDLDDRIEELANLKAKNRLGKKQQVRLAELPEIIEEKRKKWEEMKEYKVIVYDASESHLSLYANASSRSGCRSHMDEIVQRN